MCKVKIGPPGLNGDIWRQIEFNEVAKVHSCDAYLTSGDQEVAETFMPVLPNTA